MSQKIPTADRPGPLAAGTARRAARRSIPLRSTAVSALAAVAALTGAPPAPAQVALSADGVVESKSGGFRFPDGTTQTSAGGGAATCAAGDFLYCYSGPPETLDVGACRPGTRACDPAAGDFGACSGEIIPAAEVCDGRDNDCDGDVDPGGLCDGELVISEILYDASGVPDESFEWFEVHNPNPHAVNMLGWVVRDDDASGREILVVQSDLIVAAGGYAVLCHNGEPSLNGGVVCDYEYGHLTLTNTADELVLEAGGGLVDAVAWDETAGWPAATSGSLSLDPSALSTAGNDLPESWCNSPESGPEIPSGDQATPGEANVPCP